MNCRYLIHFGSHLNRMIEAARGGARHRTVCEWENREREKERKKNQWNANESISGPIQTPRA